MSRKHLKRYLMLLSAVGLLAIGTAGSGTFATFNAEVSNPGNYFATGTIFLHATKTGGTGTCKSESDTTNNRNIANTNGCDALFTLSNAGSGATGTIGLTLDNAGSINASKLQFALGAACVVSKSKITTIASGTFTGTLTNQTINVPSLPYKLFSGTTLTLDNGTTTNTVTLQADAPASGSPTTISVSGALGGNSYTTADKIEWGTQFGSPTNLCSSIQVYVEEDATLGGSPTMCLFGGNAGSVAACTFGGTSGTAISGIGTNLVTNQFTNATLGASSNTTALDGGGTRFFKIGYQLPAFSASNQGNQDQNTAATFDLKWHIEQ